MKISASDQPDQRYIDTKNKYQSMSNKFHDHPWVDIRETRGELC